MNDALKLQISAFIDGELSAAEGELLTRRLSQDAGLRRQAAEYLEIGRLLRGESSVPGAAELRARIAAAIDDDLAPAVPPAAAAGNRLLRPVTGVAIAASVAVLALLGLRQVDLPDAGRNADAPGSPVAAQQAAYTEPSVSEVLAERPDERLMQYYLSHGATNGDLGANGILSRLVTLELRGGELVEVAPAEFTELELEPGGSTDDNSLFEAAQEK